MSRNVFVLVLLLVAAPARAAVEASPHDLIAQGYDVVKVSPLQERCSRCHLPSAASGSREFLTGLPEVLAGLYTPSTLTCFSCHDGTTIVSPNVDATRTAFHPASHGNARMGQNEPVAEPGELPDIAGARMQCDTCHDPHDNGHRPFLRADLQELCLGCHSQYAEYGLGKENRSGNHILAPDPLAPPRPLVPVKVAEAFRTGFASAYPPAGGKGAGGWHWDLGGHLGQGAAGSLGCGSCHAVHGDEDEVPAGDLLALAPVNDVANLFCEGCHAGTRGDERREPPHPNPGGTTTGRTYHPVDDDEANGVERFLEIREPPGWPFGGGKPGRLVCTTCHRAHGAWVETPLLRKPATAPGFCEECHETVPDYHHQVGELSEAGCSAHVPEPIWGDQRGLLCASCHRAHNAGLDATLESDYVPLLREPALSGALCGLCHLAGNPTCGKDEKHRASHFIGDPMEVYGDGEPPLRTDPWPESGLTSHYGEPENRGVTCYSCHSFREGALLAGGREDGAHLLARSGGPTEWAEGGESTYLCAGCHSVDPGTGQTKGHSHPMMNAVAEKLNRTIDPPATTTPGGKVNCDSCHRPHEAMTNSGYYILEKVEGENTDPQTAHPKIDFTVLCHLCHDPGKY